MRARRIVVVTGSRAEYGLLASLLEVLNGDPAVELGLIVTGTHLSQHFGMTVGDIERDGFTVSERVPLPLDDDSPVGTAQAMAVALADIAEALSRIQPDIVVLLGDRFETLAAAQAALVIGAVVAHIHGGEATEGALDDCFRHAVSKLAHLHFVAAEPYRRRVVQMGEAPDRVFNVGALGLDAIANTALLDREALERTLGFVLGDRYLLLTYHPVTLDPGFGAEALAAALKALDRYPEYAIIATGHNADTGNRRLGVMIERFAAERPSRVTFRMSLGRRGYLSAMKHAAAVVGNSSSGIIEAPAMGVPTVNIGDRQKGRLRADSVIDCAGEEKAIVAALDRALDSRFRKQVRGTTSPYGRPGAARLIAETLKGVPLSGLVIKRFHDIAQQVSA